MKKFYYLIFIFTVYGQSNFQEEILFLDPEDKKEIIQNAPSPQAVNIIEKNYLRLMTEHEFEKSIELLNWSKSVFINKDSSFTADIFTNRIKILIQDDDERIKKKLKGEINTSKDEYWPTPYYSNNKKYLFYTTLLKKKRFIQEDIYYSLFNDKGQTWGKGKNISSINNDQLNDAVFSVSGDGSKLLMFRSTIHDKDKTDLYISFNNNTEWSAPKKLPEEINHDNDYEGGAFISYDGNYLLFSFDSPNSIGPTKRKRGTEWGNQDLFVSENIGENEWSSPINLGNVINTHGAELTPFLSSDGWTLYFSSNGHPNLGEVDIFKAERKNLSTWTEWNAPVNLGRYINTPQNDLGYKKSLNDHIAYLASRTSDGDYDIFTIEETPAPIELVEIQIIDDIGNPIKNVPLSIKDSTGAEISRSKTNDKGIAQIPIRLDKISNKKFNDQPQNADRNGQDTSQQSNADGQPQNADENGQDSSQQSNADGQPQNVDGNEQDSSQQSNADGQPQNVDGNGQDSDNSLNKENQMKTEPLSLIVSVEDPALPPYVIPIQINQKKDRRLPAKLSMENSDKEKHLPPYQDDWFQDLKEQKKSLKEDYPNKFKARPNSTKLIWPLKSTDSSQFHYDAVSMYMDHDINIGSVKDYNCGNQSYDLKDGYNHSGTDIMLWPYSWNMMDTESINVIASASGIILDKFDGEFDRNCSLGMVNGEANTVVIMHADGSLTIYAHLKKGTVITKPIGSWVEQGDPIGNVGSSGLSTGPHLHFEVVNSDFNIVDPFGGKCSGKSWWKNQKPYSDTAVNHMITHDSFPAIPECPEREQINDNQYFFQGDTVYLSSYYRDLLPSIKSTHRIIAPSQKIKYDETAYFDNKYIVYPEIFNYPLDVNAETGEWTYEIVLDGKTYLQNFFVNEGPRPPSEDLNDDGNEIVTFKVPLELTSEFYCTDDFILEFGYNEDILDEKALGTIDKWVTYFKTKKVSSVKITGFADSDGNPDDNLDLSRRRAENVADQMKYLGIRKVGALGKGEEHVIRDEFGREIKDKSRRVEICFK